MSPVLYEWLNLVLRFLHVVAAIAWIGASFYFNWLLNRLQSAADGDPRVLGELWAVHGGGFFKVQKRSVPAGALPEPLHWFKWEAYWTWMSGFALLVLIYYLRADVYLIDPSVRSLSHVEAVGIGLGVLVGGWLVYDTFWRTDFATRHGAVAALLSFAAVVGLTWALTRVFSGRGAYLHVGAMLGTLMAANVFRVIIPAQKHLVQATEAGGPADATLAARAGQRSLHNNYMTLPVLLTMLSGHYAGTWGHPLNWLILAVLFAAAVGVRHFFNVRHLPSGRRSLALLGAAAVAVMALAWFTAPAGTRPAQDAPVPFARVQAIIETHCVSCHAADPENAVFRSAIKGVHLETPQQIQREAQRIEMHAVVSNAMPLGNATGMTRAERDTLGAWVRQGARIE